MFRTAEFRHFGNKNRAPGTNQQIGSTAQRWIRRDTRETIRPSTLHTQNQLTNRAFFSSDFVDLRQHPLDLFQASLDCCLCSTNFLYSDLYYGFIERLFALE